MVGSGGAGSPEPGWQLLSQPSGAASREEVAATQAGTESDKDEAGVQPPISQAGQDQRRLRSLPGA